MDDQMTSLVKVVPHPAQVDPNQKFGHIVLFDESGQPLDLSGVQDLSGLRDDVDSASTAAATVSGSLDSHLAATTDVHGVPDMAKVLRLSGIGPQGFNLPAPGAMSGTPLVGYTPKTQQTISRPIFLGCPVAVVSEPGQNGHISLQIAGQQAAPNQAVAPPDAWFLTVGTVACRNNATGAEDTGEEIGCGGQLSFIVPSGWWWRLKFEQITGYANPSFLYTGAACMVTL